MSKEYIVETAICKCIYGTTPGKLKVIDNKDVSMNGKYVATHNTLGNVFAPPGFGTCKKSWPSRPCQPVIKQWSGYYDGVTVNGNSYPLTDGSKGTCACGGPDCITFQTTGQIAVPGVPQMKQAAAVHQMEMNPMGVQEALADPESQNLTSSEKSENSEKSDEDTEKQERKVLDVYWEKTVNGANNKERKERCHKINSYQTVPLCIQTEGYKEKETVTIEVISSVSHKFKNGVKRELKGEVNGDGIAEISDFELSYEKNATTENAQKKSALLFIDKETHKEITDWEETIYTPRMTFYIHGTTSDKKRWNNYHDTVRVLNRIAFDIDDESVGEEKFINHYCDFNYEWTKNTGINNSLTHDLPDRIKATNALVKHIKAYEWPEEIVLIGHSHGGNVAIMAADILAADPKIKHVYVLSIATPAGNREEIETKAPIVGLKAARAPEKGYKCFTTSAISITRIEEIYYYYVNPENPMNWENKNKITHMALWNTYDWVDELAGVQDNVKSFFEYGVSNMNADTDFFESTKVTQNVAFNINPFEMKYNVLLYRESRRVWKIMIDYLRYVMAGRYRDDYFVPSMRGNLKSYAEYEKDYVEYKNHCAKEVYVSFFLDVYIMEITSKADKMHKGQYDTDLFKKLNLLFRDQKAFTTSANTMQQKKNVKVSGFQKAPNEIAFHYQLQVIDEYISKEYDPETEQRLEQKLKIMEDTSLGKHGFDLIGYEEIEESIDDGRIRPFKKTEEYVLETEETKTDR